MIRPPDTIVNGVEIDAKDIVCRMDHARDFIRTRLQDSVHHDKREALQFHVK